MSAFSSVAADVILYMLGGLISELVAFYIGVFRPRDPGVMTGVLTFAGAGWGAMAMAALSLIFNKR